MREADVAAADVAKKPPPSDARIDDARYWQKNCRRRRGSENA